MVRAAVLRRRSVNFWGWLFVLPTMAGLLILNIIPIWQVIRKRRFRVLSIAILSATGL